MGKYFISIIILEKLIVRLVLIDLVADLKGSCFKRARHTASHVTKLIWLISYMAYCHNTRKHQPRSQVVESSTCNNCQDNRKVKKKIN